VRSAGSAPSLVFRIVASDIFMEASCRSRSRAGLPRRHRAADFDGAVPLGDVVTRVVVLDPNIPMEDVPGR
jgi:hypothetical protein